jgi:hypothetical protein
MNNKRDKIKTENESMHSRERPLAIILTYFRYFRLVWQGLLLDNSIMYVLHVLS